MLMRTATHKVLNPTMTKSMQMVGLTFLNLMHNVLRRQKGINRKECESIMTDNEVIKNYCNVI